MVGGKQVSLPQISHIIGKSQESFHKYPLSVTVSNVLCNRVLKLSISFFSRIKLKYMKTVFTGMENNWKQSSFIFPISNVIYFLINIIFSSSKSTSKKLSYWKTNLILND